MCKAVQALGDEVAKSACCIVAGLIGDLMQKLHTCSLDQILGTKALKNMDKQYDLVDFDNDTRLCTCPYARSCLKLSLCL